MPLFNPFARSSKKALLKGYECQRCSHVELFTYSVLDKNPQTKIERYVILATVLLTVVGIVLIYLTQ